MTYLAARRAFEAGNKELAWVIAQQDEGMSSEATKEQFFAFVEAAIANDKTTEKAAWK